MNSCGLRLWHGNDKFERLLSQGFILLTEGFIHYFLGSSGINLWW